MGLFDIDFHKLKKDIGSKAEELAKTAQKKVNGVSNNVAPTLNQAVKTAKRTASNVSKSVGETVVSVGKTLQQSEIVQNAKKTVGGAADAVGTRVSDAASKVATKASQWRDDFCDMLVQKIKDMIAGIDIQSMIGNIQQVGKEKNIDVSSLVNFLPWTSKFHYRWETLNHPFSHWPTSSIISISIRY